MLHHCLVLNLWLSSPLSHDNSIAVPIHEAQEFLSSLLFRIKTKNDTGLVEAPVLQCLFLDWDRVYCSWIL